MSAVSNCLGKEANCAAAHGLTRNEGANFAASACQLSITLFGQPTRLGASPFVWGKDCLRFSLPFGRGEGRGEGSAPVFRLTHRPRFILPRNGITTGL